MAHTEKENPFKAAARLRKIDRYVEAIDEIFPREGITVRGNEEAVVWGLRQWTAEQWARLAVNIGARPPSPETIAAICSRLERRAAEPEVDPFERFGGVAS